MKLTIEKKDAPSSLLSQYSDAPSEKSGIGWGLIAIVVCGVPALYFFALGPAILLHRFLGNGPTQRAIEVIYAPLDWLDSRIPGTPFTRYAELWDQLVGLFG